MGRDRPEIIVGSHGEDVWWYHRRRALRLQLSSGDGPRLYPAGLSHWPNGEPLDVEQQRTIFRAIYRHLRGGLLSRLLRFPPPAIVVYAEDPDRERWEQFAREEGATVEHASDAGDFDEVRGRYVDSMRKAGALRYGGRVIRTEAELDAWLAPRWANELERRRRQRTPAQPDA